MGGIKAGIDYYHSRNQFVAINASYSGTILQAEQFFDTTRFPITTTRFYSASVSISNNYKIKRLLLGYGISYSKYTHYTYYTYGYNIEASKTYKSTNNVIGLVIPIYYQITNHFFVGLEYKPSIWRISSSNPVDYEHVINFEFGWKIF